MANTVDKVIDIALAEVGYLEKASNSQLDSKTANAGRANYTKYGRDMHNIYPSVMDYPAPWCDAFVDWCFYKAYGVATAKSLLNGNFDDYTVQSAQMYKNKGAWYTSNPKVGDQIFFKDSGGICHTGLVYKVTSSTVFTIEGNTSGGSTVIANGGGVCKKSYSINSSYIAGYGRPKYDKAVANTATPTMSVQEVAREVIAGKWGNGTDRINALKKAGYDPTEVQTAVNAILSGKSVSKSVTEIAKEVIAGKWGNDPIRSSKLKAAGYDPAAVQKKVNELLK